MISKEDKDLFRKAVQDVVRLDKQPHLLKPVKKYPKPTYADDDIVIKNWVGGEQIIHFCQPNYCNTRAYNQLKKGDITPELSIDLHEKTSAQAKVLLQELLVNSNNYCLCIIHGKGSHSKDGYALLKSLTAQLLRTNERVLAYHSCPAKYGGTGAVLVLLKN